MNEFIVSEMNCTMDIIIDQLNMGVFVNQENKTALKKETL
jgi:hypothetical protein